MRNNTLIEGAVSGFVATVPMTLIMEFGHRMLPQREQYPLPPSEIVQVIGEATGIEQEINEEQHVALSLLGHFGYGTAAGMLYAPIMSRLPMPTFLSGMLYGLVVWSVSYLGWLPAVGIPRPATQHPKRRNALTIGAHIVWGAVLGLLCERLPIADHNRS